MKVILKKIKTAVKQPGRILEYVMVNTFLGKLFPDKAYLEIVYRLKMGKKLNLENPQTFNEKLQWLKLYDRKDQYTALVDKYEVRKYIAEKLGEEYLIPCLGVWDKFDDIDFDSLPDQFVLKCTHDSGGLVICRDKSKFDIDAAREKITKSLKRKYFYVYREWPYKNVKPRIIAEEYMEDKSDGAEKGLTDYKFYCFNSKPTFAYISLGLEDHETASISYVTLDWDFAPFKRTDFNPFAQLPEKPVNFDSMIKFSEILSEGKPFSRIDFYEINGKVYVGEITFFPGSGFTPVCPEEWDYKMGTWLTLPEK